MKKFNNKNYSKKKIWLNLKFLKYKNPFLK